MLLTVPCSQSDVHLLPNLAKVIRRLGPYGAHKLLVVPTKEIESQAKQFAEEISSLFASSSVEPVNLGITGWPIASNKHFKETARLVAASQIREAFYFFEPDNTPMVVGWLDQIQAEYVKMDKPFYGCVIPTRGWTQGQTGLVPQDGEPHMVGTGIYPPNLFAFSVKIHSCDVHMPFNRLPLAPFDSEMRHETVPNAFGTALIQHNWQTKNYRVENEQIVCDDMDNITPELSHKKPWDGKAIVLHGCKDGSLAEIVLAGKIPKVKAPEKVLTPSNIASIDPPGLITEEKPKGHPSFLATRIHKELNGGKMTAKGVAEKLKITIPEVLAVIAEPSSGLKVAGPVKWVSVA